MPPKRVNLGSCAKLAVLACHWPVGRGEHGLAGDSLDLHGGAMQKRLWSQSLKALKVVAVALAVLGGAGACSRNTLYETADPDMTTCSGSWLVGVSST